MWKVILVILHIKGCLKSDDTAIARFKFRARSHVHRTEREIAQFQNVV